jgi:hypothetical protein
MELFLAITKTGLLGYGNYQMEYDNSLCKQQTKTDLCFCFWPFCLFCTVSVAWATWEWLNCFSMPQAPAKAQLYMSLAKENTSPTCQSLEPSQHFSHHTRHPK